MRIIFTGSAPLACACLKALFQAGQDTIAAVVTQPDRPKGRHLKSSPCAVKALAEESGLPVLAPANVNSPESVESIRALAPDLVVVVAYGQILKSALLNLPPMGCVNIHASLLPHYRGAAPIQWAVANGDDTTGVTSIFMNERMDAGDIIFRESLPIRPDDTAASMHDRIATLGGELLLKTLNALREGNAPRTPQNDADATFAPKLAKADGRIDWTCSAVDIYNRIRGFDPWPGTFCVCPRRKDGLLRVKRAAVEDLPAVAEKKGTPGRIVDLGKTGPLVRTGEGALRLLELQPAGGKTMDGNAYLCGHRLAIGEQFE